MHTSRRQNVQCKLRTVFITLAFFAAMMPFPGTVEAQVIPAPEVVDVDHRWQDASCTGVWHDQGRVIAPWYYEAYVDDETDTAEINNGLDTATETYALGYETVQPALVAAYDDVSSIYAPPSGYVRTIDTPPHVQSAGPVSAAGLAASLISVVLGLIGLYPEDKPKEVDFPATAYSVLCEGNIFLTGTCQGTVVVVEERECVLQYKETHSPDTAYHDVPETRCTYNELQPSYGTPPINIEHSCTVTMNEPVQKYMGGDEDAIGTYSRDNRNLPSMATVCYMEDYLARIVNRPQAGEMDDIPPNVLRVAAHETVGGPDCDNYGISWPPIIWRSVRTCSVILNSYDLYTDTKTEQVESSCLAWEQTTAPPLSPPHVNKPDWGTLW